MPTTDLDDPRVKLMQKWSREMPEMSPAQGGLRADADDDDEDDGRSVKSSYSSYSQASHASISSFLGSRKFYSRRAGGAVIANTAHAHTTAATTTTKSKRSKKGKKTSVGVVSVPAVSNGQTVAYEVEIKKETADANILNAVTETQHSLHSIQGMIMSQDMDRLADKLGVGAPFRASLSQLQSYMQNKNATSWKGLIRAVEQLRLEKMVQQRADEAKYQKAMVAFGVNSEQFAALNDAKIINELAQILSDMALQRITVTEEEKKAKMSKKAKAVTEFPELNGIAQIYLAVKPQQELANRSREVKNSKGKAGGLHTPAAQFAQMTYRPQRTLPS
jgi:hypothetical protein